MSSEYDIPPQKIDFKQDLNFGHQGEGLIRGFLESLNDSSFEVKTDRYQNGRMVIETEQNPYRRKDENGEPLWQLSGLNVTKATWWVYVFSLDGGFVAVEVARLKRYLRLNPYKYNENTKRTFGGHGDNPTRGYLIMPNEVIDLLTNPKYDTQEPHV
jgi:hypothetical protein